MKQILLLAAALTSATLSFSQSQSIDFENISIAQDTFRDGRDSTLIFTSDDFEFPVLYDTSFNYWASGFAMSTMRDTSDGTFQNLYIAYVSDIGSENIYTTANLGSGDISFRKTTFSFEQWRLWNSLEIANTTYAYKSMLNGDAFAKKFGGASGNDPDYFFVRIYGTSISQVDSIDFYLADFRFEDNNEDYIIDDWTEVNLSALPVNATEISFKLFSSDTGAFGINTPLFFSLDNIEYSFVGGFNDVNRNEFEAHSDGTRIQLNDRSKATFSVYDVQGRLIHSFQDFSGSSFNIEPKNQLLIITRETAEGVSVKKLVH
ncbi:MAG TPA: hypothetical protein DCR48_09960 [Flavobacteriales bacterium]|nr:hypothetical protein [Flavobacteriales bacterium]